MSNLLKKSRQYRFEFWHRDIYQYPFITFRLESTMSLQDHQNPKGLKPKDGKPVKGKLPIVGQ